MSCRMPMFEFVCMCVLCSLVDLLLLKRHKFLWKNKRKKNKKVELTTVRATVNQQLSCHFSLTVNSISFMHSCMGHVYTHGSCLEILWKIKLET